MLSLYRPRLASIGLRRTRYQPAVEGLESRRLLVVDPLIAEFQAINDATLVDEDGDTSDWIEIRNEGTQQIDLTGWYLTDDFSDLTQWRFPSGSTIDEASELLVFASGKNRWDGPQGEHHTNFRLAGGGESLVLVHPDGISIAHAYESYPPQVPDQSYGVATGRKTIEMIGAASTVKTLVPKDDALTETWRRIGFDDSRWQTGHLAVGYEVLASGVTLQTDFSLPLGPEWIVDLPVETSSTVETSDGALVMSVPRGDDVDFDERGVAPLIYRTLPEIAAGVRSYEITTHISHATEDKGRVGLAVVDQHGRPAVQIEYSAGRSVRVQAEGHLVGDSLIVRNLTNYFLRLKRLDHVWIGSFKVNAEDPWQDVAYVVDGADDRALITQPRVGAYARSPSGRMKATFDHFEIAVEDESPLYRPHVNADASAMNGTGNSIYLRIPFQLDVDPAELDELSLVTRVDDGFAAYLNGAPLTTDEGVPLQVNGPPTPEWNSTATIAVKPAGRVLPQQSHDLTSSIGRLQIGENMLAVHGMNVDISDKDFFFDATLVAADIVSHAVQTFVTATPGAPNELPSAPPPIIHSDSGLFFGTKTVEMSLPEPIPSIEIRYTLDGSNPTLASALYTGPLTLTNSAMLQARAFDTAKIRRFATSNPASKTLIATDESLRDFSSNLPVLVLDGYGTLPNGSNELAKMNVVMLNPDVKTGRTSFQDSAANIAYAGRGGARDRGSSTAAQAKPNMTFETWGATGTTPMDDEDVSWLGLADGADWVLHAPFTFDRSYARNPLALELSKQMGHWASNYRFIEVYLDASNRNGQFDGNNVISPEDFMGIYVLTEKIEQGPNRLDIAETTPDHAQGPQISGGYIWKIDRADPDAGVFAAGGQNFLNWVYPKSPRSESAREDQKATESQQQWVTNYFNAFRSTLNHPNIHAPEGYSKYIDPESWVDHHLLNVFLANLDAFSLSAYLFKDQNGRIEQGPLWDFDRTAESDDHQDDNPNRWGMGNSREFFGRSWFSLLFRDPGFWQLYIDRWQMWRDTVFSTENVERLLQQYEETLAEGASRAPFPELRPRTQSPYFNHQLDGTFAGEFNNLKRWIRERARFIENNFVSRAEVLLHGKVLGQTAGAIVHPATKLTLRPATQEFFDDHLLIDPSTATGRYLVIGDDRLGESWTAREFDDRDWESGPLGFGYGDSPFIQTTVDPRAAIKASTTFLTRIDFEVDDLVAARNRNLLLRVWFYDGLVVYLNGEEVATFNQPDAPLAWNSKSQKVRPPVDPALVDITPYTSRLVEGTNTISFRSINMRSTDRDMLLSPELISRAVSLGTNPDAVVYYTLDGTDPRGIDGQPSASAHGLVGGGTITVEPGRLLTVRNFDTSFRGKESEIVLSDWSGPRVYNLVSNNTEALEISEINYHPSPPNEAEATAGFTEDDFEFVEVRNSGSDSLDLHGIRLAAGIEFNFVGGKPLASGQHRLVVANPRAFEMRYGSGWPVLGQFIGNLSNDGERIALQNGLGDTIISVDYSDTDPWPSMPDGVGATLELKSPDVPRMDKHKWYSWQSSRAPMGTPGTANSQPKGVVINEVLASPESHQTDAIELHNTTGEAVDVSGWFVSDSADNLFAYEIPTDSIIPPAGYLVLNATEFNRWGDAEAFGLSGTRGERVYVVQGVKNEGNPQGGDVLQFVDDVHFPSTRRGSSFGRIPNGTGRLTPLRRTTLNSTNTSPRIGSLLVTEVQFNPVLSDAALAAAPTLTANDLEFIEVHNTTDTAVDLTGWQLRGDIRYDFTNGTVLGGGESIVILTFDPNQNNNLHRLAAFRAHYGIDDRVRSLGGYTGRLNDADDIVVLLRPDGTRNPQNPPRIQEDEVLYDNRPPWPVSDGRGFSLQRHNPPMFGNEAASWFAAGIGSPGQFLDDLPGDLNHDSVLNVKDIDLLLAAMRSPMPDLAFDLNDDKQVDAADRDQLVTHTIGVPYGDVNFDRRFDSEDIVAVFVSGHYLDDILDNSNWATGDWDGDGEFDHNDIVLAQQKGDYQTT